VFSGALFLFGGWLVVRMAVSGPSDPVPDLIGLSVDEAEEQLAELGMRGQIENERLGVDEILADHVARQDPPAGTPVKRIRTVRLMLSTGPRDLRVPSLVGESRSRAVIALEQQGFEIDYVASAPSFEVPRDVIIAQEPEPSEFPVGTMPPLRLLASLGPPARYYVMAELRGRPARSVRAALEKLGFRVSESPNRRVIANVAPGTIVGQQPQSGFRIVEGGEIILQVSR